MTYRCKIAISSFIRSPWASVGNIFKQSDQLNACSIIDVVNVQRHLRS